MMDSTGPTHFSCVLQSKSHHHVTTTTTINTAQSNLNPCPDTQSEHLSFIGSDAIQNIDRFKAIVENSIPSECPSSVSSSFFVSFLPQEMFLRFRCYLQCPRSWGDLDFLRFFLRHRSFVLEFFLLPGSIRGASCRSRCLAPCGIRS